MGSGLGNRTGVKVKVEPVLATAPWFNNVSPSTAAAALAPKKVSNCLRE
jgi:hypothetical protein